MAVHRSRRCRRRDKVGLISAGDPGGAKARPVAWKLALLAADGRVLAEQQSFLWENPAK